MAPPPRAIPTPRARRIYAEILSLTVEDVVWVRDEMAALLDGDPPAESAGVREPRPRRPDSGAAAVGLELPWGSHPDDYEA